MTIDKDFEKTWDEIHRITEIQNIFELCLSGDGKYAGWITQQAWELWQAARAIDAKRIVELEAWANRPVTDNTQLIANMEAQITDLEAQNKAMREVLQAYSENKKIGLAATCVLAALDKEGE